MNDAQGKEVFVEEFVISCAVTLWSKKISISQLIEFKGLKERYVSEIEKSLKQLKKDLDLIDYKASF